MTQTQLNRAVAEATGETVEYVQKLGFNLVIVPRRQYKPRNDGGQSKRRRRSTSGQPGVQQPSTAA
jgi:hypothetical protein